VWAAAVIVLTLAGCSDSGSPPGPAAERGRQLYLAQCTACHNSDPAQAGPVGPPLKGTPRAVVESKVVRGTYPPGYAPKRSTSLMPPQPALAPEIPALAEFLK